MIRTSVRSHAKRSARWAALLLVPLLGAGAPLQAEPPPWAPAHGYHKHHPKKGRGGERVDIYLPWHGGPAQAPYQPVVWQNPDDHQQYTVTPVNTYQRNDERYCREYITEAHVAGERQQIYGTACRQPDGSWEIVN